LCCYSLYSTTRHATPRHAHIHYSSTILFDHIMDEYAPQDDELGQVKMWMELMNISMKKNDNPKILFAQITTIEQRHKCDSTNNNTNITNNNNNTNTTTSLTDSEKLWLIRTKAPMIYQQIIITCSARMYDAGGCRQEEAEPTLLNELRNDMYYYYLVRKFSSEIHNED